jgi:hypothetical protein
MLLISYDSQATAQPQQITESDKDMELLQEALEIVASMSDNIANLAIQYKTKTNSPEITKQEAVALVEKITDLVIVAIKKARNKKISRNIALHTQEELTAMINQIADKILEKIQ